MWWTIRWSNWGRLLRPSLFCWHRFRTTFSDIVARASSQTTPPTRVLLSAALVFMWPFHKANPSETAQIQTNTLFANATKAIRTRDFVEADRVLHELLRHLYVAHTDGVLTASQYMSQRARVCSELANVNLMLERYGEVEQLIKRTVRDCHVLHVALDDPMVVELSLKLALIYQHTGRVEEATWGFDYCIRAMEEKLTASSESPDNRDNERALLGMCHNYFSKFLHENGSLESALVHAEKAAVIARELYPPDHLNCLHLLCDQAVILIDLTRFAEARSRLDEAKSRIELRLSDECPNADELLLCLVHILLQRVTLEALDGQTAVASRVAEQVDNMLTRLSSAESAKENLTRIRTLYNL